jgi:hypothetical protein
MKSLENETFERRKNEFDLSFNNAVNITFFFNPF